MKTDPEIDYFATSLPNMLLFEDDLKERNSAACLLLMAFAQLGLGDIDEARSLFQQILKIDSNALEARIELRRLNEAALDRVRPASSKRMPSTAISNSPLEKG
jgi:hypothetical protein